MNQPQLYGVAGTSRVLKMPRRICARDEIISSGIGGSGNPALPNNASASLIVSLLIGLQLARSRSATRTSVRRVDSPRGQLAVTVPYQFLASDAGPCRPIKALFFSAPAHTLTPSLTP